MDSYLSYRIKSYFIVGEWFLGAIIIIYFLYPLLSWLMNKNILFINFIVIVGYILMYKTNFFVINKTTNIISCINSFYFGMLAIKFQFFFFKNKITLIISFLIFLYLYFIKLSRFILIWQIQGFAFFIILVQIGQYIMLSKYKEPIEYMGKLSYNIFLVHHKIIFKVFGVNNPTEWRLQIILLIITIILTIIWAKILSIIVNEVIKTKIFRKLDSFFLN